MDVALNSSNEEFSSKLKEVKAITFNLIDSYTQPFLGLVKFAEQSSEAADIVKSMFRNLFAHSAGMMEKRQKAISDFLKKSHELREMQ